MVPYESTSMSHERIVLVENKGKGKNRTKGEKTKEKKSIHTSRS